MRGIVRKSVASQLLLLVYLEVVEWVPLFPWNDLRRGNGHEGLDLALAILMAAAIYATAHRWRLGMAGAVGL